MSKKISKLSKSFHAILGNLKLSVFHVSCCFLILFGGSCGVEVGNPPKPPKFTDIAGVVHKGPTQGATVELWQLDSSGSREKRLATTLSDEDGGFYFDAQIDPELPVLIRAAGGTYQDEASGQFFEVELLQTTAFITSKNEFLALTPLSQIAQSNISAKSDKKEYLQAVRETEQKLAELFGLKKLKIKPVNPKAKIKDYKSDASKYMLIIAGLTQAALDLGLENSDELIAILEADFEDGIFDGKRGSESLKFKNNNPLDSDFVRIKWKKGIKDFVTGSQNESGISDSQADEVLETIPSFE